MRPSIKLLTWGITPVKDNKTRFQYDYKSIFLSFFPKKGCKKFGTDIIIHATFNANIIT